MTTAASDYPLLNLFWTFVWFFALMIEFWLLITVFGDLFRRHDLSGWGKTGWVVVVLVLPIVGAVIYLVLNGRDAAEREAHRRTELVQQTEDHIRSVAAPGYRGVDEIARAKELLDRGAITQEEFEQLKRRVLV